MPYDSSETGDRLSESTAQPLLEDFVEQLKRKEWAAVAHKAEAQSYAGQVDSGLGYPPTYFERFTLSFQISEVGDDFVEFRLNGNYGNAIARRILSFALDHDSETIHVERADNTVRIESLGTPEDLEERLRLLSENMSFGYDE